MELTWADVFNKESIKTRAREHWEVKTKELRLRAGRKYEHIFTKFNKPMNDWSNSFDDLTLPQQRILIKGEIIRTYDSLPNNDKSDIKRNYHLSKFESKWFKLPSGDKKKILSILFT